MGKITIHPPQIDLTRFQPHGLKWAELVVAVGRLSPEKNFGNLIHAVGQLDWPRLVLIGDGPLYGELCWLADAVGDDRVVLLGAIPNDRVARWLSLAEYFVCPSLYEQAPKVVWEAMASECACVISAQVGVVEDGVTGYLCDPDVCGIGTALERARKDENRREVAKAARKLVEGHLYAFQELIVAGRPTASSGAGKPALG